MKFIVFDTETTGLPKNYKAPVTDLQNWPRIISLAWVVFDENENVLKEKYEMVKPDGWVIPKEKFWVENGYSTEKSMEVGVPLRGLVEEFIQDLDGCDLLIAHNMGFDSKIIGAEMLRLGLDTGKQVKKFCTKETLTNYCQIPTRWGFKWPTLLEAHLKLFGTGFDGAHDALADVKACGKVFFEAQRRGIIKTGL
jgi:DNA polymerase III epsilon subunit-like protein